MFASLVALDGFYQLQFTQLSADLTSERSGGSMFHLLSHIYAKTFFFFFVALKQLQRTLWIFDALLFLIDCEQTQHPLWTQLSHWQKFMQNKEYTAFWYLQLLCYLMQLQFTIGQNEIVEGFFACFLCMFSGTTSEFGWFERSASFLSVRLRLKSTYNLLNVVSDGAESE